MILMNAREDVDVDDGKVGGNIMERGLSKK